MKLAEVLAAHRWSPSLTSFLGGCFGCAFHGDYGQFVAHHVEAVTAAGLAVVELPTASVVDVDDEFRPKSAGDYLKRDDTRSEVWVEGLPGSPPYVFFGRRYQGPSYMPAEYARAVAAALLAAAAAAEHPGTPVEASPS